MTEPHEASQKQESEPEADQAPKLGAETIKDLDTPSDETDAVGGGLACFGTHGQ